MVSCFKAISQRLQGVGSAFLGTGTFLEQSNVWDFNPSRATRSYDLQYVTTMKRERLEIDSKNQYKLWMRSFG